MRKKILTMSLVLVMVLPFAACEEEAEEEVELPLAQEIVDGVIASWAYIRTSQFDTHMTMDFTGEFEDKAFKESVVTDSSGKLDVENKQMEMDMTMNVAVSGQDEIEMVMEMYLIGDTVYMMKDIPQVGSTWAKSETPEGTWEQVSQTESQIELLKTAQVNVIGSEKVGSVDCYVIQLIPDMEQLWQIAMQQATFAGQKPDIAEQILEVMFRSFSAKQWIAKDTYFLTKTEAEMNIELTPEAAGFPKENGVVITDISMVLLFYNYNQPVSITLPPGAEEASVPQS